MLLLFFITSVVILFMDIITDILAAIEFFSRGDKYWGISTLIPIFAPFVAKVAVTLVGLARCFRKTAAEPTLGTSKQGNEMVWGGLHSTVVSSQWPGPIVSKVDFTEFVRRH